MTASIGAEVTAAEWVMVGINAFAAIATAVAAFAAWRSARAARETATMLGRQHEIANRVRIKAPLIELRRVLATYTTTVSEGEEGSPTAKDLQKEAAAILRRELLSSDLPESDRFAEATVKEVELADKAFEEVERKVAEIIEEGGAFR